MRSQLLEIAFHFLRLGVTAFGGPAAHIAMMQVEFVERRKWLTQAEFLDLLGASNLIPGPNSTELAMHIGYKRAGIAGLLLAGFCFIFPASLIVAGLASLYVTYGKLPQVEFLMYILKPIVIALVFQSLWNLGSNALKTNLLRVTALVVALFCFLGANQIVLLFGTGLCLSLWKFWSSKEEERETKVLVWIVVLSLFLICGSILLGQFTPAELPYSPAALFLYFLKVGSVIYGSGYVLLAFLRADLVMHYHWLNQSQLMDAIAAGQITPGPVFTAATFIGYLIGGPGSAMLATIGIFLPAFLLVASTASLISKMRDSKLASAFLDAVNAAALALMGVVLLQLGHAAIIDITTVGIALISSFLLLKFKLNPIWLMVAAVVVGALHLIRV